MMLMILMPMCLMLLMAIKLTPDAGRDGYTTKLADLPICSREPQISLSALYEPEENLFEY